MTRMMTAMACLMAGNLPEPGDRSPGVCNALMDNYPDEAGALADEMGFPNPLAMVGRALGIGGRKRRATTGPRQFAAGGQRFGQAPRPYGYAQPPMYAAQPPPVVNPPASQLQGGIYVAAWDPFVFNLAQGLAPISLTLSPFAAFRGRRFVVTVTRIGTTAASAVPLASVLQIGATPMILGGEVPVEVFQSTAQDTNLTFPLTSVGTPYRLTIRSNAAVTGTDVMTVSCAVVGDA